MNEDKLPTRVLSALSPVELCSLVRDLARLLYEPDTTDDTAAERDAVLRRMGVLKDVKRDLFPVACPRCRRKAVFRVANLWKAVHRHDLNNSTECMLWRHDCSNCGFSLWTESEEIV